MRWRPMPLSTTTSGTTRCRAVTSQSSVLTGVVGALIAHAVTLLPKGFARLALIALVVAAYE